MTCKCGDTGIYNEVAGKGYYYCRSCRDEIVLEITNDSNGLTQREIDDIFDELDDYGGY